MRSSWALVLPCVLAVTLLGARAEAHGDATFVSDQDTTISSTHTTYSNGHGTAFYVGNTVGNGLRRALLYFNLTSTSGCTDNTSNGINDCAIPSGSQITYAQLRVEMTRTPASTAVTFSIRRLLQGWGEAGSDAPDSGGGQLVAALAGDATWTYRSYASSTWSSAGGSFSGTVSASASFSATLGYKYLSSSTMVSDVQGWVNSSGTNHGWIMLGPEASGQTARQFATRENATVAYRPVLHIQYLRPQGAACSATHDCKSGLYCTDGVCCNVSACTALNECHNAGSCQAGSGTCSNPSKSNGTACSDDGKVCTSDYCSGGNCTHPADKGGTLCNASGGECDLAESCQNGNSNCPADAKKSSGTTCTADTNPCTLDQCNGSSNFCQHPAGNAGTVCNASVGVCDVAETCDGVSTSCPSNGFKSSSVQCRAPSCVNGTTAILPANCTGSSASCPPEQQQDCTPNTCSGNFCLGGCTLDSQCSAGNYCAAPNCLPKKSNGSQCGAGHECTSGNCIDGVCCNTVCGNGDPNDCQACDTGTVGTCEPLAANTVCRGSAGVCDVAEKCNGAATSCPSDSFKSSSTQCRAPSCANGVETLSADCPGNGASCPAKQTQTCDPFVCGATACRTSCTSDTHCIVGDYCNGSSCVPKIATGLSCSANHQCASGHCTDGVCCNTACTGQCQACDLTPGTCKAVTGAPRGSRPACAADGSACDGYCNGTLQNSCFLPGGSVECTAPSCTNGVATLQAFCNGTGACPAVQKQTCSPYSCGPTQCFANCSLDVQCTDGYFCSGGICKSRFNDGHACGAGDQCMSGFCTDGVCCDAACSGQCEACDVSGSAGTCTPVAGAPHGARPACITDGSLCGGTCDGQLTSTCAYAGPGTICRQASCTNDNATLEAFCTGTGHCPAEVRQDCAPFSCNVAGTDCQGNCTLDTDCAPSEFCAGGVCASKRQLGEACSSSESCISGVCVDGFCCNEACTGQCEACDVAGSEGTCGAVTGAPHGTRTACTGDGTACDGACDGSNRTGCSYPGTGTQCRTAACASGVATLSAHCNGDGVCPAVQQQVCPGNCSSGICGGGCTTNSQCGAGKYCSAGVCVDRLANGQPCGANPQCTGGQCVDGFCCDSACTGQCVACDVPGSEGFCTPVKGRPHGGRATCGGTGPCGAQCDGTGSPTCVFPGSSTFCGVGSCSNGVATGLAVCNSAGTCLPPSTQDCAPYRCDGAGCGTSCTTPADCQNGFTCDATGKCAAGSADAGSDAADAGSDAADSGSDASLDSSTGGSGATAGSGGTAGGGGAAGTAGAAGSGASAGSGGTAGGVDAGTAGAAGNKGGGSGDKGGCGCRVPADPAGNTNAGWLLLLGLGLALYRRRERASLR